MADNNIQCDHENSRNLNVKETSKIEKDINKINSIKSKEKNDDQIIAHYDNSPPAERVTFEGLDDRDSICSEETENVKMPPIPDGGWGWVVVAAAFLVSACADGLAFSFGLLHQEFTQYFETTQSKTSLIGSLFIASPLLAGPIMSALVDRFGCRVMTMIAGVLSTVGFLLASVSNSVEMVCLTFGLLSGLAMGILYVTAVVSVAFWFDKRRNLAVSLASCGIGFGTLIYSPMTHYFLEVYDWRNTLVLLAGTLLNMCVCGALMADPEWLTIKQKRERKLSKARSKRSSSAGSISSKSIAESVYLSQDELKSLLKSGKSPEYILETLVTSIAEAETLEATTQFNADQAYRRMHSYIHLPTFIQQNEKVPPEVIEKLMTNKRLYNIIIQNYPDLITRRRSETNLNVETPPADGANQPVKLPLTVKAKKPKTISESEKQDDDIKYVVESFERKNTQENNVEKSVTDVSSKQVDKTKPRDQHTTSKIPLQSQTSWFAKVSADQHCLRDMPLYRNTIMHRGAMLSIPRYKLRASSLPDIYRNSSWSLDSESDDEFKWYNRFWQTLKTTFDFRMFTEFHFLMFNLSSLILSVWFIVPYFFLQSYMTSRGVEGGPIMISIIGVASSIGIVALGWAGDQPWINVTKTYATCLIICGATVAAYPLFITSFWPLTVISAVFGLSFASSYSYTPAILMELMPIDNFTVAYGLILLSQGIGHLVGPPIGGLLYDLTGAWDLTFYMGGAWLVVSGLCVGVIAYTKDVRLCGSAQLLKEAEEAEKNETGVANV